MVSETVGRHVVFWAFLATLLLAAMAVVSVASGDGVAFFWRLCGLAAWLGFSFCVYFFPAIVAVINKHPHTSGIVVLNLFLGWTFLGWVLALVWAATVPRVVVVQERR